MEKAFQFEEVNDLLFGEVLTGETVGPRDPAMEGIEDKEAQVKRCRTKQARMHTATERYRTREPKIFLS